MSFQSVIRQTRGNDAGSVRASASVPTGDVGLPKEVGCCPSPRDGGEEGISFISNDDTSLAASHYQVCPEQKLTIRKDPRIGWIINTLDQMRAQVSGDVQRLGLTTIAFASSGATTLMFNLVLVRVLSPSAYGGVARTFSLGMAVAQLTMAGVSPAIARQVAHGDGDNHRFARARGGIRSLGLSCGVASLLYFPLALAGLAPTDALSLLLGWALAFVYACYFGLKLLLFALDWSARYAGLELMSDGIFFITLALLAVLAPTAGVLTFSIAYAVFIVIGVRIISRRGRTVERVPVNQGIVTYAGWASVATYASVGRFTVAVALTGALAGSVAAGRFAAVLSIMMPFFLIPQAAGMLTFAGVARARGEDASRRVRSMCRVSAWVSAVSVVTCCLFAHQVVRILLGPAYASATSEFVILILCVAPQIVAIPIGNALAAQGSVVLNASVSVAAFVVLLVALPILVHVHGALGVAIAFSLSMLVSGLAMIVIGRIRFRLGVSEVAGTVIGMGVGLTALVFNSTSLVTRVGVELLLLVTAILGFMWMRSHRPTVQSYS